MTITKEQITADMTIESIFSTFPHKAQKLALAITKAGLNCVGCSAATWETLEAGMLGHGMSKESISRLLQELNAIISEELVEDTIILTKRAAEKFKAVCQAENKLGIGLRFKEVPAGCNGFEYQLGFSEKADPIHDVIYTSHDVQIHIEKASLHRLLGSEIDYVEGLQSGFKISNPNARSSCGCGNSHGY